MEDTMKKRKVVSMILALAMLCAGTGLPAVNAQADSSDTREASGQKPADYVKPTYEEGKINLNGYYTVANDGGITAELEWSFPYENPQRPGEGMADPARPYTYRMWQSKKNENGTWSNWETRSPVDVDARDGSVRVLNVAPNAASTAYLKNWMGMAATDYDGTATTVGRGIIQVDAIEISQYNSNPNAYLKNADGTYKYNVLMFGTYDANANQDLNAASQQATLEFAQAGGGIMFGHDTVTNGVSGHPYFNRFAQDDFLGITLPGTSVSYLNTNVKVVDTGFLTSRPWNLEGATLTIPAAHVLGQYVPNTSTTRVWMQFSDAAGNVVNRVTPGVTGSTDNYYLITKGPYAMIQTGHSNGQATLDEAKVFANTLIYIAQTTTTTTARDSSFIDEAAPQKPSGQLAGVTPAADLSTYTATIALNGSEDYGTTYAYRIQGIRAASIDQSTGVTYPDEVWSSTATNPDDASIYKGTAKSGLRGYYVSAVNTSETPIVLSSVPTAQVMRASSAEAVVNYETAALEPGKQYYVHAFAVDYAGNVSEDLVIPVSVSAYRANFYHNDGTDHYTQTLLSDTGKLASIAKPPVRPGYEFLGWYEDINGEGEPVSKDDVFDMSRPEYLDGVKFYAKWIKLWNVTLGQKGEGQIILSSSENGSNPYRQGTDVTVSYEPAAGYAVKAVWLDGVMQLPQENRTLVIPAIEDHHYVLVEFVDEGELAPDFYSVETQLTGGGAGSSITPSIRMAQNDPRTENYTVTWNAGDGYVVTAVKIDGMNRADLLHENQILFSKVEADHKVEIILEKENTPAVSAMVTTQLTGGPGSITPSADVAIGDSYTVYASVADPINYELVGVTVYDAAGNPVPGITADLTTGEITVPNIVSDYRVVVEAAPKQQAGTVVVPESEQLRVNTGKTGQGTISDSMIVKRGDAYTVEWEAASGWHVQDVTIDGNKIYYNTEVPQPIMLFRSVAEGTNGDQPFEDIQDDHSVQVVFAQDPVAEPEDPDAPVLPKDHYKVMTQIQGDANVSVTASNTSVKAGDPYEITWNVEEDSVITHIYVNGELRSDLLTENKVVLDAVEKDYQIEIVAERIGDPLPKLDKTVVNTNRTDRNLVGDRLAYSISAQNQYPYRTWENVQIMDQIPAGMELDTSSLSLMKNGIKLETLPASCYNAETRMLTVPIGDIESPDVYTVTFETVIRQEAIQSENQAAQSLTNLAWAEGDNAVTSSQEAKPNEEETARPLPGPDPMVSKTAVNEAADATGVKVGDTIRYGIKVENRRYGSVWTGVRITDQIPEGLTVDPNTIYLIDPSGVPQKLDSAVYQADSRMLSVMIGDIFGEERYEVTFTARVEASAVGKDIGNIAVAYGADAVEEGAPGHWGSKEEYEISQGGAGDVSVVEEDIQLQTEKAYAGSTAVAPGNQGVATGDQGVYSSMSMLIAAAILLAGLIAYKRRAKYNE